MPRQHAPWRRDGVSEYEDMPAPDGYTPPVFEDDIRLLREIPASER